MFSAEHRALRQVGFLEAAAVVVLLATGSASGDASAQEAFVWTPANAMISLGTGPFAGTSAHSVSADGSVIAGRGVRDLSTNAAEPFLYTAAAGYLPLGHLPGYEHNGNAIGLSADGSVAVGVLTDGSGLGQAFRWTAQDGMVGLGHLPGHSYSNAVAVSADGQVIAGVSTASGPGLAFRWTMTDGMVALGDLPEGGGSAAVDLSLDGNMIVGSSNSTSQVSRRAFIWDPTNGIRDLREVIELDFALDLNGWLLEQATGISDDGNTIVGEGRNASGDTEAWIFNTSAGFSGLGDLSGGRFYSAALDVSADGTVVVGRSVTESDAFEAFRWTLAGGMEGLGTLNSRSSQAFGASLDGSVVVGFAEVPEPGSVLLVLIGLLVLACSSRAQIHPCA